jgi:hypothetical protein
LLASTGLSLSAASSCADSSHTPGLCVTLVRDYNGETEHPSKTGCCCPHNEAVLKEKFKALGKPRNFCLWDQAADLELRKHNLFRRMTFYGARCEEAQVSELYDKVCTKPGQKAAAKEAAASADSLTSMFSSLNVGITSYFASHAFKDGTESPDCADEAERNKYYWFNEHTNEVNSVGEALGPIKRRQWMYDKCPCVAFNQELSPTLSHCVGEGLCEHLSDYIQCKESNTVLRAGTVSEQSSAYNLDRSIEEDTSKAEQQKRDLDEMAKEGRIQSSGKLFSSTKAAEDALMEGAALLSEVERCCGTGSEQGWAHCSRRIRKGQINLARMIGLDKCVIRQEPAPASGQLHSHEGSDKRHERQQRERAAEAAGTETVLMKLARESKEKKDCQAKNSYMISRPTTCDSCKKLSYCECHLDDKKHPVCESVGEREQREEEEDHRAQRTARKNGEEGTKRARRGRR